MAHVVEASPGFGGFGREDGTVGGAGEVDDVGEVELVLRF